MAAWPSTLPSFLKGFQVTPRVPVVRTEMDAGLAKMRRRATYSTLQVDGEMICTQAQVEQIELFYLETTRGGSVRFSILAPHTDQPREARFLEGPVFTYIGGNYFRVGLKFELVDTLLLRDNAIWPDGDNWIWPSFDNAIWP